MQRPLHKVLVHCLTLLFLCQTNHVGLGNYLYTLPLHSLSTADITHLTWPPLSLCFFFSNRPPHQLLSLSFCLLLLGINVRSSYGATPHMHVPFQNSSTPHSSDLSFSLSLPLGFFYPSYERICIHNFAQPPHRSFSLQ